MDNLDYLKYKDYERSHYLKGSRTSNRSNHSHHSQHSNHSRKSYHSIKDKHIVETRYRHQPQYNVRTNDSQHYFPQRTTIKPEFSAWSMPTNKNYTEPRFHTENTE